MQWFGLVRACAPAGRTDPLSLECCKSHLGEPECTPPPAKGLGSIMRTIELEAVTSFTRRGLAAMIRSSVISATAWRSMATLACDNDALWTLHHSPRTIPLGVLVDLCLVLGVCGLRNFPEDLRRCDGSQRRGVLCWALECFVPDPKSSYIFSNPSAHCLRKACTSFSRTAKRSSMVTSSSSNVSGC